MSDDVDVFLEHYGVRGMKWGIRNKFEQINAARRRGLSSEQKRKLKVFGAGAATGLAVSGAVAVAVILKKRANVRANALPPLNQMWNYYPKSAPVPRIKDLPPLNQMWNYRPKPELK